MGRMSNNNSSRKNLAAKIIVGYNKANINHDDNMQTVTCSN